MFLVLTKDIMLFKAVQHIVSKDTVVHIQHAEELCTVRQKHAKVIIDTLNNNIFYTDIACQLEKIEPAQILIFSPFAIKRCFGTIPVTFIRRDISLIEFMGYLNRTTNCCNSSGLSFSRRQHQMLTYILQQKNCHSIAEEMRISLKTYYCHKYNVMLLLKLRKMSDLVRHQFVGYLQ